jgi:hypothetical protein
VHEDPVVDEVGVDVPRAAAHEFLLEAGDRVADGGFDLALGLHRPASRRDPGTAAEPVPVLTCDARTGTEPAGTPRTDTPRGWGVCAGMLFGRRGRGPSLFPRSVATASPVERERLVVLVVRRDEESREPSLANAAQLMAHKTTGARCCEEYRDGKFCLRYPDCPI